MKKYFLAAWLLLAVAKSSFSQNFGLNCQFSRLLDFNAPTFVLGAEFNTPRSESKTLQISLGYGGSAVNWETMNAVPFSSITIFRYGIEQKYFYEANRWNGGYLSYAFEGRNMQMLEDRWVLNCETGDCFEEIKSRRRIRNAYNLMGRWGVEKRVGKIFYYDLFCGMGVKLVKKNFSNENLDINNIYKVSDNHYLYPAFSLGFRVGFILK